MKEIIFLLWVDRWFRHQVLEPCQRRTVPNQKKQKNNFLPAWANIDLFVHISVVVKAQTLKAKAKAQAKALMPKAKAKAKA